MLLRVGSTGQAVSKLIVRLHELGYIKVIHDLNTFTDSVKTAVMAFQSDNGLKPDGVVGDITKGALYPLVEPSSEEYECELADYLNVDPKLIHAFAKVESSGGGFLPNGEIKVLFERHRFRRQLLDQKMDLLVELLEKEIPDLCNIKAGGYIGGPAENNRLAKAMRYHRRAAMEAASYGKFQVMGFRYGMCGYSDVEEFVAYMERGEKEQYKVLGEFIKAQPELQKAMQELDFLNMALIYNGPKQQGYDALLRNAYEELL